MIPIVPYGFLPSRVTKKKNHTRFVLTETCYPAGQRLGWHRHSECAIVVVLQGGFDETGTDTGNVLEKARCFILSNGIENFSAHEIIVRGNQKEQIGAT